MNDREINDDLIDVSDDKNVDIKLDIDSSHESSIEYNQESQEIGNDSYSNMQNNDISAFNNGESKNLSNPNKNFNNVNKDGINSSENINGENNGNNSSRRPNNTMDNSRRKNLGDKNTNNNDIPQNDEPSLYDNRSLKQKAQDTAQNIKDTADKIKNAPENIKNKIDDTKQKIDNAKNKAKQTKEKIKNAPENIKNKANKAKDMWNNRPKNFTELKDKMKDGLKNSGSKLADKAKQGAKKAGQKAVNTAKDSAKEGLKQSKLGQTVKKTKDTVDKAKKAAKVAKHAVKLAVKAFQALVNFLVATFPYLEIVLAVLLVIFAIVMLAVYLFPGLFGDVKNDDEYENYAEVDKETLEKLKEKFAGYEIDDAALGMATVVFPYFSQLYDGNVSTYLSTVDDNQSEDEDEDEDNTEEDIDGEDIEKKEDDQEEDDMYLLPFRNSKVRKRLEKVLSNLKDGKDKWEDYLKNTYFKDDSGFKKNFDENVITGYNGYKKLFKAQIDSSFETDLEDAIIQNLYDIKHMFYPYVIEGQVNCTSSLTSIGYSDVGGIIQGEAYVILKDTAATTFNAIKSAADLHDTGNDPLPLKRYAMGVAYSETGKSGVKGTGGVTNEATAKAEMIAAQSFVLGRTSSGSHVGMGYKYDVIDGKTYFYMRGNTFDQDFCDVYEGCRTGRFAKSHITAGNYEAKSNVKDPLSAEELAQLEKWYDEIAGEFIYEEKAKAFGGSQLNTCKRGHCLSQTYAEELSGKGYDYNYILYDSVNGAYTDGYVAYNMNTQQLSVADVNCSDSSVASCAIAPEEFKYYSQRQFNDTSVGFCGRTASSGEEQPTISTSGCGVTSMAMIVSNLTDENMDPVTAMNEAASASNPGPFCGPGIVGTDSGYYKYSADKHGINYSSVIATKEDAEQQVKNTLNSGGLVIANVGKGWQRKDQGPVEVGHYLVVRGISSDGTLLLADPMLKEATLDPNDSISFAEIVPFMKNADGSPKSFYLFTSDKSAEIKEKYCTAPATGDPGVVTGYLGNPIDPARTDVDYYALEIGNSKCYPNYCNGGVHAGVDLNFGTLKRKLGITSLPNIYAMDGGTVSAVFDTNYNCTGEKDCAGTNKSFGIAVTIKHGDTGYSTHYAHLSSRIVNVGDTIAKGQQIGVMGNTGNSSGEHLHIELRSPLYAINGRDKAKGSESRGLMNPTRYIDKNITYIGQGK